MRSRGREGEPRSGEELLSRTVYDPGVAEAIQMYEDAMTRLRAAGAFEPVRRRVAFVTTHTTSW